jgi:hypothetical protein
VSRTMTPMLRLAVADWLWSIGYAFVRRIVMCVINTVLLRLFMFVAFFGGNYLSIAIRGTPYFTKRYWADNWIILDFSICLSVDSLERMMSLEEPSSHNRTVQTLLEPFRYTPIPIGHKTIRLLLIYPRPPEGAMKCALFQNPLSSLPRYEAISYCWGSSERDSEIIVNGQSLMIPSSALRVLKNRSSFWEPKLVWIDSVCIDQNNDAEKGLQISFMKDIYGKASSVSIELLATPDEEAIKAELSASWVGKRIDWTWTADTERKDHKDAVFKHIMASATADVLEELHLPYWRGETDALLKLYNRFAPQRFSWRFDVFRQFLSNPWFERMWVLQEAALARSIRFRYEGVEIQWDHLVTLFDLLLSKHSTLGSLLMDGLIIGQGRQVSSKSPRPIVSATFQSMAEIRRRVQSNEERPLAELLTYCRRFQASHLKDKIFAIHGICSQLPEHLLRPDCSPGTTPRVLFLNAAESLVYEGDVARMLGAAGTPFNLDPDPDKNLDLPSWAPDWSKSLAAQQLSFVNGALDYQAGGLGKMKARIQDETLLLEDGYSFDTIAELGDTWRYHTMLDEIWEEKEVDALLNAIRSSISLVVKSQLTKDPYLGKVENGSLQDAIWRTGVGNRVFANNGNPAPSHLSNGFEQSKRFLNYYATNPRELLDLNEENTNGSAATSHQSNTVDPFWRILDRLKKNPTEPMDFNDQINMNMSRMMEFHRAALKCWGGRAMCITTQGYIGVVPPSAEVEDKIVVFAGMQTPLVLRVDSDKQHRYIGDCYVHGIMNGEVLNGDEDGIRGEFKII